MHASTLANILIIEFDILSTMSNGKHIDDVYRFFLFLLNLT